MILTHRFRFAVPALLAACLFAAPQAHAKDTRLEGAAFRVKKALRADRTLAQFKLDTDTVVNHLELEGWVRSYKQRTRAFHIARRAAPYFLIKNRITVRYR